MTRRPASGPLAGRRVLVTRAADDAGPLLRRLRGLGADVIALPTILRLPPEDLSELDALLLPPLRYDWVVFASRAAVWTVLARLAANGWPATEWATGARLAAVGGSTRRALARAGLEVACVAPDATAESLAEALASGGLGGARLLLPSADIAGDALPRRLRAAGAHVDVAIAYRTVRPVPDPRTVEQVRQGIDAVLFASPSAARNLAAMLGGNIEMLHHSRAVCIGPTTASAIRAMGLEPAAVATESSDRGLVTALLSVWQGEG